MNVMRNRPLSVLALAALVAATGPPISAVATGPAPAAPNGPPARELRSLYTNEHGVDRPSGVTFDPRRGALVVAGPNGAGGTKLVEVTPTEDRLRTMARPNLGRGDNLAFDLGLGRLYTGLPERLAQVADARGSAFAPDGTQFVLDATSSSIVSIQPDATVTDEPIAGLEGTDLAGLAYNPADERLYVAEADGSTLYALDDSKQVVRSHDMTDAGIADLRAMTFAPSADPNDQQDAQSLYVADAGDEDTLGRITEITTAEAIEPMATRTATLVDTHDLAALDPPSTDSAGIAYIPDRDELVVSDSEINETGFYEGVNLFTLERDATYVGGGTTEGWARSTEPTGTAYDPETDTLYVSNDDADRVSMVEGAGADNLFGTGDDGPVGGIDVTTYGNPAFDAEGVAVDTRRDWLLIVDGEGSGVLHLDPGPDGEFATGDDQPTYFDTLPYGVADPEGIEYDAVRDRIAVLNAGTEAIYEFAAESHALLDTVDVSAANSDNAAGLAIAPASDGSGARHYYAVDRGVDNNSDPNAVDGRMYELAADLGDAPDDPPGTNEPPTVDAGPDQTITLPEDAQVSGTASDTDGPGELTTTWSRVSGPGAVQFADGSALETSASFSEAGDYVLELEADDTAATVTDTVAITVEPEETEPPDSSGPRCGDVSKDVCAAMWEHKQRVDAAGVRDLGDQVGTASQVAGGARMRLSGGTLYWSRRHGPHAVWGAILTRYQRLGGPGSFLGFPVTDERAGGAPRSRLSRFSGGRILWSKATRAHEVHGAIEKRFLARGGSRELGLPTTDERRDGRARFNRFQRGARIYWSRATGPRLVYGAILGRYLRMGGHRSVLGLPVREEHAVPGGRRTGFEDGSIYWNRRPTYTVVTQR